MANEALGVMSAFDLDGILRREDCCTWTKGKEPQQLEVQNQMDWIWARRGRSIEPRRRTSPPWTPTYIYKLDTYIYSKEHPELQSGSNRWVSRAMIEIFAAESFCCRVRESLDTISQTSVLVTNVSRKPQWYKKIIFICLVFSIEIPGLSCFEQRA